MPSAPWRCRCYQGRWAVSSGSGEQFALGSSASLWAVPDRVHSSLGRGTLWSAFWSRSDLTLGVTGVWAVRSSQVAETVRMGGRLHHPQPVRKPHSLHNRRAARWTHGQRQEVGQSLGGQARRRSILEHLVLGGPFPHGPPRGMRRAHVVPGPTAPKAEQTDGARLHPWLDTMQTWPDAHTKHAGRARAPW